MLFQAKSQGAKWKMMTRSMIQFSPILAIPILQIRLTIHTMDTVTDSYSKYPVSNNPKQGF